MLEQAVIVENRPGASSIIGADVIAKAAPDGYQLLSSRAVLAINPSMFAGMPFNAQRDLAPVLLIAEAGDVFVVHPALPTGAVS